MANLSIRNLDKNTYEQLRIRAAMHGLSMEQEVRQIIYQAINPSEPLSKVFQKHFGKKHGVSLKLSKRKAHQPLDID